MSLLIALTLLLRLRLDLLSFMDMLALVLSTDSPSSIRTHLPHYSASEVLVQECGLVLPRFHVEGK